MTTSLHPFDPTSSASTWTPQAFGLERLPVFDAAPVGNHRQIATCSLLYRFFDDERRLLYVGVTTVPANRWRSHRHSDWWTLSRFVSLEPVPPAERLRRETQAIRTEQPRFNRLRPGLPLVARIRLDRAPRLVVAQLREEMNPEDFAALVAAFKAEPDSPTGGAA